MKTDPGNLRRVALLARPGPAFDRLRVVVDEAGVECVVAADPGELDPAQLQQSRPEVVLVALDALVEDALERLDPVLGDPAIDVIYEETEIISGREGWAVARWQRHLIAKLQGHGDVLPPGRELDDASSVPAGATVDDAQPQGDAAEPFDAGPVVGIDSASPAGYSAFDPLNLEGVDGTFDAPPPETSSDIVGGFDFSEVYEAPPATPATAAVTADPTPGYASDASFDFSLDLSLDPPDGAVPDFTLTGFDPDSSASAEGATSDATLAPLTLEMAPMETSADDSAEDAHQFQRDLGDLDRRISTLELVDDTPARGPEKPTGAVLVLSGIGGPDAVRQLLGALPKDFARPVLVQQRLEGGRHDKLVAQMQRATQLPVRLAESELPVVAGTVYILPTSIGLVVDAGGLRFTTDPAADVLATLPTADSAILLLSGSDPAQIDAVMNHGWAGALVAGQAAEGCYDAAAPNALAARGGITDTPALLASRLIERWPARGTEHVQA